MSGGVKLDYEQPRHKRADAWHVFFNSPVVAGALVGAFALAAIVYALLGGVPSGRRPFILIVGVILIAVGVLAVWNGRHWKPK